VLAGIFGFAFADPIASLFDSSADDIAPQLRVLSVFLPLAACYNLLLATTRGYRTMRPTVVVEALGRHTMQLLLVFLASVLGLTAVGFVTAWSIPYLVAFAFAAGWLFKLNRRMHRRTLQVGGAGRAPDPGIASKFWRFTAPRGVATIAQTLLKRSDIILVAALSSTTEAALYAAATRFVVFGQLAVQALQQALAPQMSATLARRDHDAAQDIYRTTTAWAMALAWPIYIASAVLAPWVLLLFGSQYGEAAGVVAILSLAMLAATACGSVDTVLLMAGRSWLSLMNTGIALVINVGMNFLLIPTYGIMGAAISWAVAILVRNVLPLAMINRMLGMSPFGSASAWVAVTAVACLGFVPALLRVSGAPFTAVVTATVIGGLAYLALLWVARHRLQLTAFGAIVKRRDVA
jgi:O-antigen/teichoic acid export membrane protein